jgi:hypothetical protein
MSAKYDLDAIAKMPNLEVVSLMLQPSMSLLKRLAVMEQERVRAERAGGVFFGLNSFWGLKEWLVARALQHTGVQRLAVICPTL